MTERAERLILVAHRLPVTVSDVGGTPVVNPSSGGLASALRGVHETGRTLWVGSLGDDGVAPGNAVARQLEELGAYDVPIAGDEMARSRDGFSNGVLWPLFHYLVDKVNLDADDDWEQYRIVNQRFADAVVAHYRPGDRIWVHDYQLALVPELLRARLPDARIGFFLHIPFPSADVFRILPWRAQVLRGLLGADLVGFHTEAYRNNFVSCVGHVLGLETDAHRIQVGARAVRVGAFPLGVDVARFEAAATSEPVRRALARLQRSTGDQKLIVGIDRLDYTKGIPRRLLGFERFLARKPSWIGKVRFIQVAVPTREKIPAYGDFRHHVASLVGKINGRFGSVDDVPVHFLYRSIPEEELVALYRAADVMLVTPLRDGMNLVAKEFVASRVDDDGVLVLSELAGAAAELGEATLVNPYDVSAIATALEEALTMPAEARVMRMRALRRHVGAAPVRAWATSFVAALDHAHAATPPPRFDLPGALADRVAHEARLCVMLDYDGTLVSHERTPELAAPDADLLALLARMAERPELDVHIISGRPRETLTEWFGALPLGLHAEHGFWSRCVDDEWKPVHRAFFAWKRFIRPTIDALVRRVPGSFLEEKDACMAWHYRAADPDVLREELRLLRSVLEQSAREHPVEVREGAKVLEVRARGIHKGLVARALVMEAPTARVLCAGDDETDEDMFAALDADAITIRVGDAPSRARYRLAGPPDVRAFLSKVLEHVEERECSRAQRTLDAASFQ
jgi:trehalose 6-phosphate synthase/phosphatase